MLSGLNDAALINRNMVEQEATAMLSGGPVIDSGALSRDGLLRSYEEHSHRLRVLRTAIQMQQDIVAELRSEVGSAIARDLLPQHRENVRAVIDAALQFSTALQAEHELRDSLYEKNIPFSSVIIPMPLNGVGLLSDSQSRISRYLLECHEHDFIKAADLPDIVRDRIIPKAKPVRAPAQRANSDGWTGA